MTMTAQEVFIDGTPTNGANPWIDSLVWGGAWADLPGLDTSGGPVTISYTPVYGSDPFGFFSTVGFSWYQSELDALSHALEVWAAVANIEFIANSSNSASNLAAAGNYSSVWFWLQPSLLGSSSVLGWSEIPAFSQGQPLYNAANALGTGWTTDGLQSGGYGFITLIHEIGHLLGLAHPHDGGGGGSPDGNTFPGVTSSSGDYGDYNLNQGIYTTMSYNEGWPEMFPSHSSLNYGYQATPMALDIAAIQAIYGANNQYNLGDETYLLPSSNSIGTYWSCIWDAGGTDTISAAQSSISSIINLNDAPLIGESAGGYVSYGNGIVGGFTIAHGVVIENAIGGSGNDTIIGNEYSNLLEGGFGNDQIIGGLGSDVIVGGIGIDTVIFDILYSEASISYDSNSHTFTIISSEGTDTISEIEYFQFSDVTLTTAALLNGLNSTPVLSNAISDQSVAEDSAFWFSVPSNTFSDPDGDSLIYSAALSNGSALPSWLAFAASTQTFSGTPLNGDVGTISVTVTAMDGSGATAAGTFDITVNNTNDAPTVVSAIADQAAIEGNFFTFQFPSNTFADVDVGDSLAYSATLSNGDALPSWLSFNAVTHTFSGTPHNGDGGTISINVTATDGSSAFVSDAFDLTVQLYEKNIYYENGNRDYIKYDLNNEYDWSRLEYRYQADGDLDYSSIYYDTGARRYNNYDQDNESNWFRLEYLYTPNNDLDYSCIYYDAGDRLYINYDQNNEFNWYHLDYRYESDGDLDYSCIYYDTGEKLYINYDQNNEFNWYHLDYFYEVDGDLDYSCIYYDTGEKLYKNYDQNNESNWYHLDYFYEVDGDLDYSTIYYDTGEKLYINYDQNNEFNWYHLDYFYEVDGDLDYSTIYYDTGDKLYINYDQNNEFNWYHLDYRYEADGDLDYSCIYYDTGDRLYINYDQNNEYEWFRLEEYYDANNQLLWTHTYASDGSLIA